MKVFVIRGPGRGPIALGGLVGLVGKPMSVRTVITIVVVAHLGSLTMNAGRVGGRRVRADLKNEERLRPRMTPGPDRQCCDR